MAEDKLFATLDTASRRLRFPRERDAVITDTVGLMACLPTSSRRSRNAEEMEDADLIMHVVDASSPHSRRMETVERY
ncbi:MAG: 50S ribosome-binding GTPase [Deltaproteobacteria bacterium]|nr:50S ribosome-binding GTPase [Deltaproteobacteria bacterium]